MFYCQYTVLLIQLTLAAGQMWCLATHLPLLIGDLIPRENARWNLFSTVAGNYIPLFLINNIKGPSSIHADTDK